MKVYLELPVKKSRGLQRVYNALIKYAPDTIKVTKDVTKADLVILHVIGRYERVHKQAYNLWDSKIPYVVIQYCVRSTQRPNSIDWVNLWENAKLVWSYYDLHELLKADARGGVVYTLNNFYYAPLGVDSEVFKETKTDRKFIIATHGHHALTQSVKECVIAAKRVGREVFHLGHQLRRGDDITCIENITDEELAKYYSQCEFVSGLRRIEGFEMPVLEGLLCGARPILFDKPHYRYWFEDYAVFIPEESREKVTDSLEYIFRTSYQSFPVSEHEKKSVIMRFNWETIIEGFWNKIL